jgi:hypothetical protein
LVFNGLVLNPHNSKKKKKKKKEEEEEKSQHQWLTPIILPTQEAEIRRIEVQRQPGAK